MSRVAQLALVATLASCSTDAHPPNACDLKQKIEERLDHADALDCGELAEDATPAERMEAGACALSAFRMKRAFKLVARRSEPRSGFADAYVYAGGDALVSILHYDPGGVGRKHPIEISGESCRALGEAPSCDLSPPGELCLSCEAAVEGSISCYQSSDQDACRGAGNYQAGKEGSYQPCCPGLVEVFQRSRVEVNGAPACDELPLRVYACIEGACGDGVCEAPENVPCGCKLDCPELTPAP